MNMKSILSLLSAVCILCIGAVLPRIVADRQDAANLNQMMFAPVSDVQLEFSQNDITIDQAIAMAGHSKNTVDIPEDLASTKREKVEAIAASTAKRYQQAGVIPQETDSFLVEYAQSILWYGQENQSNIFWRVHYGSKDGSAILLMLIDDRTGTVCSLEYTTDKVEYASEDMESVLFHFAETYLSSLGEPFYQYKIENIVMNAKMPEDKSYLSSEITWQDPLYQECRITFFVNRNGFYTFFY